MKVEVEAVARVCISKPVRRLAALIGGPVTRVAVDDWSPVRHRRRMTTRQLDLTGLKCPLPALKTRKALSGIGPGERLEVRCTDPLATIDIPNLINEMGDRIEATERDGDHIIFLIEKAKAAPV